MSLATGILFLILAAAFAAQAYMVFNEVHSLIIVLVGALMLPTLGALGALVTQQSHLDNGLVLGYWSTIVVLFVIEAIVGAVAFIAECEDDDIPPQAAIFALLGALMAACTGMYTVA